MFIFNYLCAVREVGTHGEFVKAGCCHLLLLLSFFGPVRHKPEEFNVHHKLTIAFVKTP